MKCAHYLHQGIGLVVVDIVTSRPANLHNEMIELLQAGAAMADAPMYAVAYHPVRRDDQDVIDLWQEELTLGLELPTMPLGLSGIDIVPLHLEATYREVCRRRLIDSAD